MNKFRPPLLDKELLELKRLSSLDFTNFTESDVREGFLIEVLKLLGYRKELDYSISTEETFNLNPLFLSIGSKRIRLDYICSLRKQYFWIIDAKSGKRKGKGRPPIIKKKDISQAHFYCLHPEINCQYFIISNGWYTNLYSRDNINSSLDPILSIKSMELEEKFLSLDSYVGSTQILPMIKHSILDQIEKTFSAEIRAERLNEFIYEVEKRAAIARGIVDRNARDAYSRERTESGLSKLLDMEDLASNVYSIFQNLRVRFQIEGVSNRVIERIKLNSASRRFDEYLFFSRMTLSMPYPVNFWYYSTVLHFLFKLKASGITKVHYQQKSVDTLLMDWIDLCLFNLSSNKTMRYLWACERIFAKIIKQIIIVQPNLREKTQSLLNKELFYIPEEKSAVVGPNQATTVIEIIESSLSFYRSMFIKNYYNQERHELNEAIAYQEYKNLLSVSKELDISVGDDFKKITRELGNKWSDLRFYEHINFDRMGSAICDILLWNESMLDVLGQEHKARIKVMAQLKSVNSADKLCEKLSIEYQIIDDESKLAIALEKFYDPSIDQHQYSID